MYSLSALLIPPSFCFVEWLRVIFALNFRLATCIIDLAELSPYRLNTCGFTVVTTTIGWLADDLLIL
jgi:hypothetical protein